ncbi:MAG: histidinol dehydrogenase [Candidatus Thermoplasmatota archaeon]|nr:histidinol dehydrogenase [Candidatus Thermoplasmatota archaeon]
MKIIRNAPEEQAERSFSVEGIGKIVKRVKEQGDRAIFEYTERFDGIKLSSIAVEKTKIERARVDDRLERALKEAKKRLELFSSKQMEFMKGFSLEISEGVETCQRVEPIERIGIYVPGGKAPLFSTLLMCAVPAKIAGVKEIAICTPPVVKDEVLYTAKLCGVDEIYSAGGAHAIAALAFGTESIRRVDKIFGPGNRYVTAAKKEVFGHVGIDMLAGPSEVLIIASENSDVEAIALDLIAQAEHGSDSIATLITDSEDLAKRVSEEVEKKLNAFEWAREAIEKNGRIMLVEGKERAIELANRIAPEHLELMDERIDERELKSFGSLFIGSPVAFGDYCAGINHVLPTNGSARFSSALSVKDFLRTSNVLRVRDEGKKQMDCAKVMAEHEGMRAHAASIEHLNLG